jgi:hypothetical protein
MASKTIETESKGIPLKSPNPHGLPVPVFYALMNTLLGAGGYAAAYFWTYSPATKQQVADNKMQILAQYHL